MYSVYMPLFPSSAIAPNTSASPFVSTSSLHPVDYRALNRGRSPIYSQVGRNSSRVLQSLTGDSTPPSTIFLLCFYLQFIRYEFLAPRVTLSHLSAILRDAPVVLRIFVLTIKGRIYFILYKACIRSATLSRPTSPFLQTISLLPALPLLLLERLPMFPHRPQLRQLERAQDHPAVPRNCNRRHRRAPSYTVYAPRDPDLPFASAE